MRNFFGKIWNFIKEDGFPLAAAVGNLAFTVLAPVMVLVSAVFTVKAVVVFLVAGFSAGVSALLVASGYFTLALIAYFLAELCAMVLEG